MNLDHSPHALIEDHYHIRSLIEGQEKRSSDREFHRNRIKSLEERETLLIDSQPMTLTDFWCGNCQRDFKAQAVRQIEVDWSNPTQRIAFYKSKCFKGHWCIRLITDRHKDGFWQRSKSVALDRGKHYADTIQPHETGFNLLYGKK